MHGAESPVVDLLGMSGAKREFTALMTGVGTAGCVALGQSHLHRPAIERAGVPAITCAEELSVPAFRDRQPELGVNLRIECGSRNSHDPAKAVLRCRGCDRGVGNCQLCE